MPLPSDYPAPPPPASAGEPFPSRQVPYFRPSVGEEEREAVRQTLNTDWLTSGPRVAEFERDFCAYVEAPFAIAVASATAGLLLALEAFGVAAGDEVLVPTMTFASAVAVVLQLGAQPVFVDCRPDTLTMDMDDLERRITPRCKAVMPMHYAGQPCELDRLHQIAGAHHLRVVEDAAHALPALYHGRRVGAISEVSCFSFYANKTITTGEGGMVTTTNPDLAKRMRLMANHGISRDLLTAVGVKRWWRYEVVAPGYKANLSDILATIGIQQLKRSEALWRARQRCADWYAELLGPIPGIAAPYVFPNVRHAWHMHVVQLDLSQLRIGRDEFSEHLLAAGVGNSVHYLPLHLHEYYRQAFRSEPEDFPAATAAYDRILSLPIFPGLHRDDVEYVVSCISNIMRRFRR